MTLTVLTDSQIQELLKNLTRSELEGFQKNLESALHEYSKARHAGPKAATAIQQPERVSIYNPVTGATTLFMPSSSETGNAVKVITLSSPGPSFPQKNNSPKPTIRPTGAVTFFRPDGSPLGLLHASALTAFRTALASLSVITHRPVSPTHGSETLVVFGCGEQAYWHVRLTLVTRGKAVGRVIFVARRRSGAVEEVVRRYQGEGRWVGCSFEVVSAEDDDYERRLEKVLRAADVIFCCTPSTKELFDAGMLDETKRRLVVAIGSYKPEMREIPGELVRRALVDDGESHAGVVVVDTVEGAIMEAGELIAAGVKEEQLVELGEIVHPNSVGVLQDPRDRKQDLRQWLQTGNVIYKSVGFGLMDLTVGTYLIQLANEKGVGTRIEGF